MKKTTRVFLSLVLAAAILCCAPLSSFATKETPIIHIHVWNDPTYVWSEDHTSVTATRTCKRDAAHVETETVSATAVTRPPTNNEEGETTYTSAPFTKDVFTVQTLTVRIPPLSAVIPGDADGDGTVDRADLELLLEYLARYDFENDAPAFEIGPEANVNGDEAIDTADLIRLANMLAA